VRGIYNVLIALVLAFRESKAARRKMRMLEMIWVGIKRYKEWLMSGSVGEVFRNGCARENILSFHIYLFDVELVVA
jgi:ABC-type polysaccharide transport system permease subunit